MKLTANAKRILSAMLVFMMVFSLVPMNVLAASDTPIDATVIFTDLQENDSSRELLAELQKFRFYHELTAFRIVL